MTVIDRCSTAVMGWLMGVDTAQVSTLDYDRYEDTNCNWAVREGLGDVDRARRAAVSMFGSIRPCAASTGAATRVRVTTSRGDLEARAVIVTVPTTVLAGESDRVRASACPWRWLEAFHGVPLGADDKVFFELAPGAMPFEGTVNFIGTDRTPRTASYETRPAGQEVLLAFFGGGYARELELRGELEACAREQLAADLRCGLFARTCGAPSALAGCRIPGRRVVLGCAARTCANARAAAATR